MKIDKRLSDDTVLTAAQNVMALGAEKAARLDRTWDVTKGTPVFTVEGRYATRGWTEWTQGFQYGCLILCGDSLHDDRLLHLGKRRTVERMLPHLTHIGVHDHGFNNLSTYGHLLRLMNEGRMAEDAWERTAYANALCVSGAVQAARWTKTHCGLGFIHSFNGPHSLFIDTMRTLRILAVAHQLGHCLMGENDVRHSLLDRSIQHALATSRYIVFHGESDHLYDVRGRTAHEGTFNTKDGNFRSRATQQGYSPYSTWTRGLAWAMLGYAEQLEFLKAQPSSEFRTLGRTKTEVLGEYLRCALETCDHYIDDVSTLDGVTYWDDGAPNLWRLGEWQSKLADPNNPFEPVDASASAIAAQGLIRLGRYLGVRKGKRYSQAGLTLAATLFDDPYFARQKKHDGLLLHSIYHWPNRWDHVPSGNTVASGESSMWGDYHLLELAHLVERMASAAPYPTFYLQK